MRETMTNADPERRLEPRFATAIDVQIDGRATVTTNISASGLYFVTDQLMVVGQQVPLELPFAHAAPAGVRASCTARVIRVEVRGRRYGIALTYEPYSFERD